MKKIYKYKNAIIQISIPDENYLNNFRTSTEVFIKKVLKERSTNGNSNTSRNIYKK